MKILRLVGDVCVTVGCCLGVGFLSGKEMQVLLGNYVGVAVFGISFFAVNVAVREFSRRARCDNCYSLCRGLFGKGAVAADWLLRLCEFVCVATALAGVQQCMNALLPVSNVPIYAVVAAGLSALLLRQGMTVLKAVNAVSIALGVLLLCLLAWAKRGATTPAPLPTVPIYKPTEYALFSVTMSLGAVTQLGHSSSRRQNVAASLIAALLLCALALAVMSVSDFTAELPTLSGIQGSALGIFAALTMLPAAVTGIAANSIPLLQHLEGVIPDKSLCCVLILGFALAMSLFGFDFAVRAGYAAVAIAGLAIVTASAVQLIAQKKSSAPQIIDFNKE